MTVHDIIRILGGHCCMYVFCMYSFITICCYATLARTGSSSNDVQNSVESKMRPSMPVSLGSTRNPRSAMSSRTHSGCGPA